MRGGAATLAALILLSGCSSIVPRTTTEPSPSVPVTARASSTVVPAIASTWPAPDDKLTPGLVTPDCTYPRPDSERNVTASTKRAAAARYSYTGPTGLAYLEYDHRIPFSLCGANTVANIWPEPVDGIKQTPFVANRKDQLEAYAARQVRYHHWTLHFAQEVFTGDWRVAWCTYLHYPGVQC